MSGFLAANILALHRNLPVTDVDRLIEGKLIQTGERYGDAAADSLLSARQTVLMAVLCIETGEMITPGKADEILQATLGLPKRLRRKLPKSFRSNVKAWVGWGRTRPVK